MTVAIRRDARGETIIDLSPVERYAALLERACAEGSTPPQEELFRLLDSMDREQLRHLVPVLAAVAANYARLWRHAFTPAFAESLKEMRDIREIAKAQGEDLWPELGG